MAKSAMEMMIQSLIKMVGLDPAFVNAAIENIRKSLSTVATDMARIRKQNTAIMAHLGIAEPIEDNHGHDGSERLGQGTEGGGSEARTGGDAAR